MASYRWSLALAPIRRRNSLNFENISSIGLKSGLYGGSGRTTAPARPIASDTAGDRCELRLSKMTTSPRRSAGTRTCSTYIRNVAALIAPSNASGARTPTQSQRRDHRHRLPGRRGRRLDPLALRGPAVGGRHRRGDPGLVHEDKAFRLDRLDLLGELAALLLDLRGVPLGGVRRLPLER